LLASDPALYIRLLSCGMKTLLFKREHTVAYLTKIFHQNLSNMYRASFHLIYLTHIRDLTLLYPLVKLKHHNMYDPHFWVGDRREVRRV
jgi:hypothetical protein